MLHVLHLLHLKVKCRKCSRCSKKKHKQFSSDLGLILDKPVAYAVVVTVNGEMIFHKPQEI
jgi:hypothetical protein